MKTDMVTGAFGFTGKYIARELLVSREPARGTTLFSKWIRGQRDWLGSTYSHELKRHFAWRS